MNVNEGLNLFSRLTQPERVERDAFCDGPRVTSPALVHHAAKPTERRAARRIAPARVPLRVLVLAWVRSTGAAGLTAPEGGMRYAVLRGEPPSARLEYSIRPRLTELADAGYIFDAGGVRDGCTVFVATDKQGDGADMTRAAKPPRVPAPLRHALDELLDACAAEFEIGAIPRPRLAEAMLAVEKLIGRK